jgi:DNA-binding beta-propeller fold protein YncE
LQTEHTGVHPVGITYDPVTRQVWVANYTGSLRVFIDR